MSNACFSLALTYIWTWICFVMIRQTWIFEQPLPLNWTKILLLLLFLAKFTLNPFTRYPKWAIPYPLVHGCVLEVSIDSEINYQSWILKVPRCISFAAKLSNTKLWIWKWRKQNGWLLSKRRYTLSNHFILLSDMYIFQKFKIRSNV